MLTLVVQDFFSSSDYNKPLRTMTLTLSNLMSSTVGTRDLKGSDKIIPVGYV